MGMVQNKLSSNSIAWVDGRAAGSEHVTRV